VAAETAAAEDKSVAVVLAKKTLRLIILRLLLVAERTLKKAPSTVGDQRGAG
jgi:hypothetical protein